MDFGTKYYIPSDYSINDILPQLNFELFIYKIAVDYNKLVEFFNKCKSNFYN